jgi:hypothetical protein
LLAGCSETAWFAEANSSTPRLSDSTAGSAGSKPDRHNQHCLYFHLATGTVVDLSEVLTECDRPPDSLKVAR